MSMCDGLGLKFGFDHVEGTGRDAGDEPCAGAGCNRGGEEGGSSTNGPGTLSEHTSELRTEHAVIKTPSVCNSRHRRPLRRRWGERRGSTSTSGAPSSAREERERRQKITSPKMSDVPLRGSVGVPITLPKKYVTGAPPTFRTLLHTYHGLCYERQHKQYILRSIRYVSLRAEFYAKRPLDCQNFTHDATDASEIGAASRMA
jgi:hypothetical protein